MAKKTDAWMPLWIGDYLSATTRLTTEQHGAYLLLIMDYWKNGPPPDDDRILAQITRMSSDAWSNASSTVKAFFEQENGMLVHARIEKERAAAKNNSVKNTNRARAAAESRWAKNAPSNAPSIPKAMLDECPSPSPSHISSTDVEDKRSQRSRPVSRPEGVSETVWSDFLTVRKAKRAPLTATALHDIEREAGKAGVSLADALAMCCARGWQGFKAEWVASRPGMTIPGVAMPQTLNRQEALEARNRAVAAQWLASEGADHATV